MIGVRIILAKAGGRHYARVWLDEHELAGTGRGNNEREAIRDAVQDCRASRYGRCRARELMAAVEQDERALDARNEHLRDLHEQHQEDLAVDEWRGAH